MQKKKTGLSIKVSGVVCLFCGDRDFLLDMLFPFVESSNLVILIYYIRDLPLPLFSQNHLPQTDLPDSHLLLVVCDQRTEEYVLRRL